MGGLIRGADTPEGRAVRRDLADGGVRVVVGTHGIASEGVRFARLGLVVIDEEQRCGEGHKVRLSGPTGRGTVPAGGATPRRPTCWCARGAFGALLGGSD